uniref:60S ribosomal protein L21 n=1 Tax=Podarcis muralis TaxID=64176 RepID=A0A670ITW3_PODMU
MTNSKGKRKGTRYMFSRQFRKHGHAPQMLLWQDWKDIQHYPACCGHYCETRRTS